MRVLTDIKSGKSKKFVEAVVANVNPTTVWSSINPTGNRARFATILTPCRGMYGYLTSGTI
jgi:hypothetical protein